MKTKANIRIVHFSILLLILACSEKLIEKPENLIAENKMVLILKDLALVNAAKSTNTEILQDNNIQPMPYLYNKHGIDSLQFVESDRYYAALPEVYERIYKDVEKKLEQQGKATADALKVRDSLNNIKTNDSLQ